MQVGSPMFEVYNRTLRRIMWAEFVDEQLRLAHEQQYRATLLPEPEIVPQNIAASIAHARMKRSVSR